jgi:adenylate cyclase
MLTTESPELENLVTLIYENISNPSLNVDFICKNIGISRSKLHRIITEHEATSTTLFIRKLRLQKAKELLLNTSLRISEIAYAIGIDSPQNFSQYFADLYQISPSNYRKNQLQIVPQKSDKEVSIAVLPFSNNSSQSEHSYISDGLSEDLINLLSKVPELNVISRAAAFAYRNLNIDVVKIAEQLKVEYLLLGSVRVIANQIRINVELINAATGFQIWSDIIDSSIAEIFEIQNKISLALLDQIKVKLLETDKEVLLKKATNNPEAHQLYLHGRYFYKKFGTKADFLKAIDYFRQALELEPNYASAYSGIAICYLYLWFYRHLPRNICHAEMKKATEMAIHINNDIPESYLAQGMYTLYFDWSPATASLAFDKALSLKPNMPEAIIQKALCQSISGNLPNANNIVEALATDPFSLINHFYAAYVYWINKDFEKAVLLGKKMIELEANFWGGHTILGFNLMDLKKYEQAHNFLAESLQKNKTPLTLSAMGVLLCLEGQFDKAQAVLNQLLQLKENQPVSNFDFGLLYAALQNYQQANHSFQKAIDEREPAMLFFKYVVRDWLHPYSTQDTCQKIIGQIGI